MTDPIDVPTDVYKWWPGGSPTASEIAWANRVLDVVDEFDHRARYSEWELDLARKVAIIAKRKAETPMVRITSGNNDGVRMTRAPL